MHTCCFMKHSSLGSSKKVKRNKRGKKDISTIHSVCHSSEKVKPVPYFGSTVFWVCLFFFLRSQSIISVLHQHFSILTQKWKFLDAKKGRKPCSWQYVCRKEEGMCAGVGSRREEEHYARNTGGRFLPKGKTSKRKRNTGRSLMIVHIERCSI